MGQQDAGGTTSAEFFPGTYSVEMRYQSTTDVKSSVTMPNANKTLTWKTATVTLAWPNQISYGGPTGDSRYFIKPTMDLLAGTYTFHFRDPNGCTKDLTWNSGDDYTGSGCPTDDKAPTASPTQDPAKNSAGWNNTDVTVYWNWTDNTGGSGIDNDNCKKRTDLSADTDEGVNDLTASCSDLAGNTGQASRTVKIDKTDPTVSLIGGPADGASYVFGSVPAEPTCDASDALSGLDGSCEVVDYDTSVGAHTVKAKAFDNAGNKGTATATYTVTAWTLEGFFKPVNMDGVLNRVKAGSTVPLKFRVFAGSTELTDPAVVESLKATSRDMRRDRRRVGGHPRRGAHGDRRHEPALRRRPVRLQLEDRQGEGRRVLRRQGLDRRWLVHQGLLRAEVGLQKRPVLCGAGRIFMSHV